MNVSSLVARFWSAFTLLIGPLVMRLGMFSFAADIFVCFFYLRLRLYRGQVVG